MRFADVIGQQAVVQKLRTAISVGRLPNAFLLLGAEGYGSLPLALAMTRYIQCAQRGEDEACGTCPSCLKNAKLQHPDVLYIYPNNSAGDSHTGSSQDFLAQWRKAVLDDPYLSLDGWRNALGVANKKCIINVRDSAVVINALSYRPYEARMRMVIIYLAEHMNDQTANKLLKSLEEPPNGTMFILTAESADHILPTILSRVQTVRLARPTDAAVEAALVQRAVVQPTVARRIAHMAGGNVRVAMDLAHDSTLFEDPTRFFIAWMRAAYAMNVEEVANLSEEFAKWGRETQRVFLTQALGTLRKVLLKPTGTLPPDAVLPDEEEFLRKFAPFINSSNAGRIATEMDRAAYHIERNGAGRIIFTDLTLSIADALREAALQRA